MNGHLNAGGLALLPSEPQTSDPVAGLAGSFPPCPHFPVNIENFPE